MAAPSISDPALSKLIFHLAKYPHLAVNGVLLAKKGNNDKPVFVDAVPLFHRNLSLVPMLEIALLKIEAYCDEKGLCIGGYYQANEHLVDDRPDIVATKLAERIYENSGQSYILMVKNSHLTEKDADDLFNTFQVRDGKLCEMNKAQYEVESVQSLLQRTSRGDYSKVVDFDSYFDDITLDWTNSRVVA